MNKKYTTMDKTQYKYSNWVFTLMEGGEFNSLPTSAEVGEALEIHSDKFVFQLEQCPTTGRKHYQGCFTTRIRKRHQTILFALAVDLRVDTTQLTVDRMQGTWEQSAMYCSKKESRVGEKVYLSKSLREDYEKRYRGKDISVFDTEGFYPWQASLCEAIFEDGTYDIKGTSGREVIWIEDLRGNSGKSLFTKFLCYNNSSITKLAFGSGSQMRAAIVEEGPQQCYIIDIPRRLCNDDFENNIYSVIEDLKNGFIKTSMYGKPKTLFMEPPVVVIFSNFQCPTEKLSVDRWKIYSIINNELHE